MELTEYLRNLTDKVYKVLPMRENNTHLSFLMAHLDSVSIDARGAQQYYPQLKNDGDFQVVIDTLIFLGDTPVGFSTWKREVLKITNLLNKIERKYGGDANG